MDQRFQLNTQVENNTFELQKTTLELIQWEVMGKLNDILRRLDDVEWENQIQDNRLDTIETRLDVLENN